MEMNGRSLLDWPRCGCSDVGGKIFEWAHQLAILSQANEYYSIVFSNVEVSLLQLSFAFRKLPHFIA
jgi:hypothetical protein